MLDRRVLVAVCLTILVALTPAVMAQSDQTGTGSSQTQSTVGSQQSQSGTTAGQTSGSGDQGQVVRAATEVFRQIRQGNLPSSIVQSAKAIAVIPSGSSTMGASHGMGTQGTMTTMDQSGRSGIVVERNTDGTWNRTPAFIRWSGGNTAAWSGTTGTQSSPSTTGTQSSSSTTGTQSSSSTMGTQSSSTGSNAGASGGDIVLVFANQESLDALMDGTLDLSTEVSVVAGPTTNAGSTGALGTPSTGTTGTTSSTQDTTTGTTGSSTTTSSTRSTVYAYSFSQGTFTGASITGGSITIDNSTNQQIYGRQSGARELLSGDTTPFQTTSTTLQPLVDELNQAGSRAE